jgi:nucleolar protein 4
VTVFAHNLPPEASVLELQTALSDFERAVRCRLVLDKSSGEAKGTAFLEFASARAADRAIERSAAEGVLVRGRRVRLALAVSKEAARSLGEEKAARVPAGKDRRHLFLAREGEIMSGSAAALGVSAADMSKRRRAAEEKAEKLRNPNFSVSKTRLHFRNLPASLDEAGLKKLCAGVVSERLGCRAQLRARVLRDSTKLDVDGQPRSRGMAFVEFAEHEHALCALRSLNNNPMPFGKERRPVVEFSLEDARAVRKRALKDKARKRRQDEAEEPVPKLAERAPIVARRAKKPKGAVK